MPILDPDKRKKYAREWLQKRRDSFFLGKVCIRCGSTNFLVIHHRDPSKKESHKIWSWAEERRISELAKCDVLCKKCHKEYHANAQKRETHGTENMYKKGCRCKLCRDCKKLKNKEHRNRVNSNIGKIG